MSSSRYSNRDWPALEDYSDYNAYEINAANMDRLRGEREYMLGDGMAIHNGPDMAGVRPPAAGDVSVYKSGRGKSKRQRFSSIMEEAEAENDNWLRYMRRQDFPLGVTWYDEAGANPTKQNKLTGQGRAGWSYFTPFQTGVLYNSRAIVTRQFVRALAATERYFIKSCSAKYTFVNRSQQCMMLQIYVIKRRTQGLFPPAAVTGAGRVADVIQYDAVGNTYADAALQAYSSNALVDLFEGGRLRHVNQNECVATVAVGAATRYVATSVNALLTPYQSRIFCQDWEIKKVMKMQVKGAESVTIKKASPARLWNYQDIALTLTGTGTSQSYYPKETDHWLIRVIPCDVSIKQNEQNGTDPVVNPYGDGTSRLDASTLLAVNPNGSSRQVGLHIEGTGFNSFSVVEEIDASYQIIAAPLQVTANIAVLDNTVNGETNTSNTWAVPATPVASGFAIRGVVNV